MLSRHSVKFLSLLGKRSSNRIPSRKYFPQLVSFYTANRFFTCSSISSSHYSSKPTASNKMSPPGILENWSYNISSEDLLKRTDDLMNQCKELYDKVGGVADSDVSYETVLKVLNEAESLMAGRRNFLDSAQHFCPDSSLRNASTEADRKLRQFCVEIKMRKDIFEKLLVLQQKGESLKPEAKRYLEELIRSGKRNGLHLDDSTMKRVKELNTKMENLSIDFMKNLSNVTTIIEFPEKDLTGLPPNFFESLKKKDNGKFELTLKYPHYFPVMEKCKVPETRKSMEFAFTTQCVEENSRILSELRKIRHELAVLLGYPNHTVYKTEVLMSKSAENVSKFLSELAEKITPVWEEEKKYLLELKEKECAELGIPFDGKLNSWDTRYFINKGKQLKYAVDTTKLREYFPFPVVKEGLLNIYQDLLGLKFQEVQGDVWHEDVELYSVCDSKSGELLGYFFLDLFPRPHKYSHAALFELQNSLLLPDGTRQVAVGAMVANFTKPQNNVPALLDHDEVVTFFHEFGHVMHYLCMEMEFAHFSIMNMERDFIEAPSQMLENWCWHKEPLKKMSSHYLDKSEIPEDVLNALIKSRLAFVGSFNLRQILLATFDQRIHSSPEGNIKDLYYSLTRQLLGMEPQEGTHFYCQFGHLANEYDAQYYGYLWSEVYSMDMFQTRFGEKNVLNPESGKDYRSKILKPGGTKDAYDLVCSFLGREPTQEAFLLSKGLKV